MNSAVAAVIVFCGPHDEGQKVPTRRIDRGIQEALEHKVPLLIAGDGNHGRDVKYFQRRAYQCGVKRVFPLYSKRHVRLKKGPSTIWDAWHAISCLDANPKLLEGKMKIVIVTDDWHMERTVLMFRGECMTNSKHCKDLMVIHALVLSGPQPPLVVFLGEEHGKADYTAGHYHPSRAAHPPYGKPAMEIQLTSESDQSN